MNINTSFGSQISIENNDILVFNKDTKVSIKKIVNIGDYKFETSIKGNKTGRTIFLVIGIIFLFFSIKLINDPDIIYKGLVDRNGNSLEKVSNFPDMLSWTGTVICLAGALIFNNRMKTIKNIDVNKNDYELTIGVLIKDDPDPKKRVINKMTICKGSFEELKEIRQIILAQKAKLDLL